MTILCYGDSNTYGYDPRDLFSNRYPEAVRWISALSASEHTVLNDGMNGREIPHRPLEVSASVQSLVTAAPDLLVIMLGSNDLLMHPGFTATDVAMRMDSFIANICHAKSPNTDVLLIAPPPMKRGAWVQENRLLAESAKLGEAFRKIAIKHHIFFADASEWQIDLTFDGVHFSEAGHQTFGKKLVHDLQSHFPKL